MDETATMAGATVSGRALRDLDEVAGRLAEERAAGRRVVLCHGCFDLLHIGHIRYLEAAKALGDVLVVTVTPDRFVDKGPDRPAFAEAMRAEHLAALACVDYAAVNRWPGAEPTIALLRPDVYAKGSEYRHAAEQPDTPMAKERAAVEAVGGELCFTDEIVFSSTRLLNEHAPTLSDEALAYVRGFRERHDEAAVRGAIRAAAPLRLLVVGETILDEYQYCEAIGKSSKEPSLVVKAQDRELFAGGILAVANNATACCDAVSVLTQLGDQDAELYEPFARSHLKREVDATLLQRRESPTVLKKRYVDGYFFQKLLEVYHINDEPLEPADEAALCDELDRLLPTVDAVIVVDFGHGMITPAAVERLCRGAKFLAINVQANAGNLGYNLLSKYPRADLLCIAQNELRLDARDRTGDLEPLLVQAAARLDCPSAIVTRGKAGCLCHAAPDRGGAGTFTVPALASKVVDRVGAGDTFLSCCAPVLAAGAPLELAAFVGSLAGAHAVATVGHRDFLQRSHLLGHATALLK